MEVQVQELIDSIKQDGVRAAEKESAEIIGKAEKQADDIIQEAEKKADRIVKDGEEKIRKKEASSQEAVKQAGRDLLISLEKKISAIAASILEKKIGETLDSKSLEKLLLEIIRQDISDEYDVIEIPDTLQKKFKEEIIQNLQKELKKGTEIRPVDSVEHGFRITDKKDSGYVSFTAEDLTAMLSPFIQKELHEMLKEAVESIS